ncbi:MAG: hypothetical protein LIR50_20455 [Bacillota bacterium]|nr:hypothetical protein [Bacillota bacterium]
MGKGIAYLMNCLSRAADFIYYRDDSCLICGREDSHLLCSSCGEKIRKINEPGEISLDSVTIKVYSYAYYGNVIRELMLRLKYKKDYQAAQLFSMFLYEKLKGTGIKPDVITYIPIREENRKKRGYNQCELIVKGLSKLTGIKAAELLAINEGAKDQIGLSSLERFKNMEGKFRCIYYPKYKDNNILLIDDVITTGATVYQGAKALKKCYGGNIYILTIAKSRL